MIEEGFTFEEVISFEVNYRIWRKYGIGLKTFVSLIKELTFL